MAGNAATPSSDNAPSATPQSTSPPSSSSPSTRPSRPDLILDTGVSVGPEGKKPSTLARLTAAFRTISLEDFTSVHLKPCAREALLMGLGAGFAIGGAHFALRANTWRAANYFVGSWAVGSVGGYQFCQKQREMERKGIGRAVEIMERKKKEKEAEMTVARAEVRRRREEERRKEEERRRTWGDWRSWLRVEDKEKKSPEERARIDKEVAEWERSRIHGQEERSKMFDKGRDSGQGKGP